MAEKLAATQLVAMILLVVTFPTMEHKLHSVEPHTDAVEHVETTATAAKVLMVPEVREPGHGWTKP